MRGYEISCVGICEIEQTEKGWYVTLIDKDAETVRREMDSEKKEKMDLDDEQRRQKLIAEQVNIPTTKNTFFSKWLFRSSEIKTAAWKYQNRYLPN